MSIQPAVPWSVATALFVPAALLALVTACGDRSQATSQPVDTPVVVDTTPAEHASNAAQADTSTSAAVLTALGWADLRIGMTRAQVVDAAGEDANPSAVGGPDPATCDEFRPTEAPDGLLVMIRNGRLSRIAIVDGTGIETDRGIAVGDSVTAVHAAHGDDLARSPHAYQAAPAALLTAWSTAPPSPPARGIAYEIGRDARVVRIIAGDESIEFPEGCV